MYAASETKELYPTTDALLEKLQEVLEKADVEVCPHDCTLPGSSASDLCLRSFIWAISNIAWLLAQTGPLATRYLEFCNARRL